jgi:DNA repair protein RecO (recombination protein O)
MPHRKAEAFVLDTTSAQERDKIVTLFTETEGKLRGVAHGAARSVKRFGGRLERLSRVRVGYFEKEGHDLVRIEDLELVQEAFGLQAEMRSAASLAYVCEMTSEFTREKESDRRYYRLLAATLDGFRAGVDAEILVRYFEFWTARLHGIFPSLEACDACGKMFGSAGARVQAVGGAALCQHCARPEEGRMLKISPQGLTLVDGFRRLAPAALRNVAYQPAALREVEAAALSALTEFMGREFRSRGFLKQVLAEGKR